MTIAADIERRRELDRKKSLRYAQKNRELLRIKSRAYAAANREKVKAACKRWRDANPEKYQASKKRHYDANKYDILEKRRLVYKTALHFWRARGRRYAKQRGKEYYRVKNQQRRDTDIQAVIVARLRSRLTTALKSQSAEKSARFLELLGIDSGGLRFHIESLFVPGMYWENRNKWHIDHKRPCASFDLADPVQQRACFHYTNLQPLWAVENLSKGARLIFAQPSLNLP